MTKSSVVAYRMSVTVTWSNLVRTTDVVHSTMSLSVAVWYRPKSALTTRPCPCHDMDMVLPLNERKHLNIIHIHVNCNKYQYNSIYNFVIKDPVKNVI